MSISYLYVNIYEHPKYGMLLYVGSCTRAGNLPNRVNKTYRGSSSLVKKYGWDKYLVGHCFIRNTDKPLVDEGILIQEMCVEFGVFSFAKQVSRRNGNVWPSKFKDGIMLNCHCNTLEQAHLKRQVFGSSEAQKEHSRNSIKEAIKVSAISRKGQVPQSQKLAAKAHQKNILSRGLTPLAKKNLERLNSIKDYGKEFQDRIHSTRALRYKTSKDYGRQRLIKCIETGDVGTAHSLCTRLGLKNADVSIRRHLNRGDVTYKLHEHNLTFMFV